MLKISFIPIKYALKGNYEYDWKCVNIFICNKTCFGVAKSLTT